MPAGPLRRRTRAAFFTHIRDRSGLALVSTPVSAATSSGMGSSKYCSNDVPSGMRTADLTLDTAVICPDHWYSCSSRVCVRGGVGGLSIERASAKWACVGVARRYPRRPSGEPGIQAPEAPPRSKFTCAHAWLRNQPSSDRAQ